jgi:hypothetical protein
MVGVVDITRDVKQLNLDLLVVFAICMRVRLSDMNGFLQVVP